MQEGGRKQQREARRRNWRVG